MCHSNISIFVPHIGCPHMCAFCNQRTITGTSDIPRGDDVRRICSEALERVKSPEDTEVAFFGGSFTAIPKEYMLELLEAAYEFVGLGKFKGIRLSTRPDYIDRETLDILRSYGVTSIELGAQSMSDKVLEANERGHSSADVVNAAHLIKEYGFELGLQMMVGLYKSTVEDESATWNAITALSPDTVRIYPVVILEGTKLGDLYKSGEYVPIKFEGAVELCAGFLQDAEAKGIKVIKLGLHASEIVESQMLGGFYHPAFRELCEGVVYKRLILLNLLQDSKVNATEVTVSVPEKNLSKALGQKKCNVEFFRQQGITLRILADKQQAEKLRIIEIKRNGGEC